MIFMAVLRQMTLMTSINQHKTGSPPKNNTTKTEPILKLGPRLWAGPSNNCTCPLPTSVSLPCGTVSCGTFVVLPSTLLLFPVFYRQLLFPVELFPMFHL